MASLSIAAWSSTPDSGAVGSCISDDRWRGERSDYGAVDDSRLIHTASEPSFTRHHITRSGIHSQRSTTTTDRMFPVKVPFPFPSPSRSLNLIATSKSSHGRYRLRRGIENLLPG